MNLFDMRTIIFGYVISNAVCAIVMVLLWLRSRERFAGLGFWVADFAMQFTAILLVGLRGILPDMLSIVVSNALVIGGTILLYIGLERFVDKRASQVHNYLLMGVFLSIHTYFALIQPSLLVRTVNLSVALIILCSQCVWLLLRRVDVRLRPITREVGYIFLAFGLSALARIFVDLVVSPGNDFFRSSVFEALATLANQTLFIILTFGLLLMVNRRLVADLARDILERERTEESLRLSEEKFFKAFHFSPDAILISRLSDGKLVEVNEGFSRLSGYTAEEALASSAIDLGLWADPRDREALVAALQEKHGIRDYEYDFSIKNGKILNCVCSAEIIQLRDQAHVLSVVRDITERKQAEEDLRRFELLSEKSRDIILFMRREDGRILEANTAAQQAYGYSREELLALTIRDLRAPETQGMTAEQMAQADAGGILFETVHIRRDGQTFPVEVSSQGATIGGTRTLISIVRDITERKLAEEKISDLSKFPTQNPYPVLRARNDGKLTYANAASRELLTVWGCEVDGYLPQELRNLISIAVENAENKSIDILCNEKVFSISLIPIAEGGYVNLYGSDITERKQAEENLLHLTEALEQRLAELQTLMDVAPVGIAIGHDPKGQVISVNRLLSEWLSAPAGSNVSLSVPEEARQVSYQVLRKGQPVRVEELPIQYASLNAEKVRNDEFSIVRSDGQIIEMLANADPLFDHQGQVRGAIATYYDITKRKQAEETVQRREAEIRSLYLSMTELFALHEVIYDASGKPIDYRILECNPAFERITGIARQAAVGKLASEVYGTHEAPYLDIYAAVAQSGDPVEFETEFSPMDKQFHISVFSPERGRFATLASDITERKQIENELLESQELFSLFMRHSPIYVFIKTVTPTESRVLRASENYQEMIGMPGSEMVGKSMEELFPAEFAAKITADDWAVVARGEVLKLDEDLNGRNYTTFKFPIPQADRTLLAGYTIDITERKRAEAERQFFYNSLNASLNEIYLYDAETLQFEFVSEGALRNLGYTLDQILRLTPVDLKPDFTPESFELQLAPLRRHEVPTLDFETRHRRADNSLYPVEVHLQLFEQAGRPVFLAIIQDTTERKRAEAELRATLEELRQSNVELEEFAYVASHDLQEPLRGIAGLVQLLQIRYRNKLDERADEYIAHIVEGTQRMQTLINDLLAYSRIGRRGNPIQPIDANTPLAAAVQNLNAAIHEFGATITNESLPTVRADATQLSQVFQNLIGNAIKFRGDRAPQIHIGVADAGDFWEFSVQDNGIGVEPQYFERIFFVFQRLHTRREYAGTGIGLAICKKIVERHGGRIWLESEKGRGTTFHFTLPKGQ